MYHHILVATGGSSWSAAAVTYAIAIAARTGAQLRVLTVIPAPRGYDVADVTPDRGVVTGPHAQTLLVAAVAQAKEAGVSAEAVCLQGSVPETILQAVADAPCDLVVIGARQVRGKRQRLGEIANIVAAKAPQPVLVVKQPPDVEPGAPLIHCVLVPVGSSPWSDRAVDYAITLAQTERFRICLLHVTPGPPHPAADLVDLEGRHTLGRAETRAISAEVDTTTVLTAGDVAQKIVETATSRNCDGIIMGTRGAMGWKRVMLGSISNVVAVSTPIPVLLVKHFWDG
jgi:nucleotide-binding universal stress UspA family protein